MSIAQSFLATSGLLRARERQLRRWRLARRLLLGAAITAGGVATLHPATTGELFASSVRSTASTARAAVGQLVSLVRPAEGTRVTVEGGLRQAQSVRGAAVGTVSARDVQCLALAIHYEAGSGTADEQATVAQVALNRANAAEPPRPICVVVYHGLGRPHGCLFRQTCRNIGQIPGNSATWERALALAEQMAAGRGLKPELADATHFRLKTQAVPWASGVYPLAEVGRFKVYSSAPVDLANRQGAAVARETAGGTVVAEAAGEPAPKPVARKPAAHVARKSEGAGATFAPWDKLQN